MVALVLTTAGNARAATVTINNATDLTSASTYSNNANPTGASDYEFNLNTYTSPGGFTVGGSVQYGSLNDVSTQALTITGGEINLINTNGNGISGNSADLVYIASGSSLTVVGAASNDLALNVGKTGNIDNAGILNIGTFGLSITTGDNVTFTGAGTTTLSGSISNGSTTDVLIGNGTNGTLVVTGSGTTNGATVNAGGTLIYGNATTSASSTTAGAIKLAGGALQLNGTAGATSETMSSLTLSGTSTLDLTPGSNSVTLSLTSLTTTGGELVISGWDGSSTTGSTTTAIDYTGSFTGTDLTNITWASGTVIDGVTYGGVTGSEEVNGQIIPNLADAIPAAPEPTTAFAALCLVGLLIWSNRRQLWDAGRCFSRAE